MSQKLTKCPSTQHNFVQSDITPLQFNSGGGIFPSNSVTYQRQYIMFCTKCGEVRPLHLAK